MPVFEELLVPEGSGRLLIMQIHPGLPPYTDTAGRGSIRIGKDCQPLTGTLRRKIAVETGETDFTAEVVAPADADPLRVPLITSNGTPMELFHAMNYYGGITCYRAQT